MENAAGNAKYTSVRTQNELISICEDVVREYIGSAANASVGFSILADVTVDISGEEQLSLGVRFVDTTNKESAISGEFLGFTPLAQMDAEAETIANTLIAQRTKFGLDFYLAKDTMDVHHGW